MPRYIAYYIPSACPVADGWSLGAALSVARAQSRVDMDSVVVIETTDTRRLDSMYTPPAGAVVWRGGGQLAKDF